jgi:hypothetical protein
VAGDDDRDGERHGGVQPVPASGGQDDRASHRHAPRRGGVRDRVEQDRRDGRVPVPGPTVGVRSAAVPVVCAEDQRARRHGQGGNGADDEHGQAIDLGRAGDQPADRRGGHQHLEHQQPPGVDQRGDVRRAEAALRSPGTCGEMDRQQGHTDARGVEKIVTAGGEHGQRVRGHAHDHQAGHERQVEHQDDDQPLYPRHPKRSVPSATELAKR